MDFTHRPSGVKVKNKTENYEFDHKILSFNPNLNLWAHTWYFNLKLETVNCKFELKVL